MDKRAENLLRKAINQNLDEKERQELLSLFHFRNLEFKIKAVLNNILDDVSIPNEEGGELRPLFSNIWETIGTIERKKRHISFNFLLKVAAVLFLGIIIGKLFFGNHGDSEISYYTSIAPKGSVSQVVLPDSSYIYLNANSVIKYNVDGAKGNREVFLEGEAWFNVQKSERKPFIVHTHFYDVKVKGTEFNLKAYNNDDEVITTLEKGSIVIEFGKLKKTEQLEPGEQLVFNRNNNSTTIKNVDTHLYTSWKGNRLIFINMSFKDLVALLERKYGVKILVEDPEILKYHYDGIIKNESIIEVLNLLKQTLPIDFKIKDQLIDIKVKR